MTAVTDPRDLGTILGVWAHPDDECYLSAGIMATAVRAGQRVVCVTATRGEAGETSDPERFPVSRLAEIRAGELETSMAILGVTEHHWLGHPDGKCHLVEDAVAIDQVLALVEEVRPDTVLTFPPDGLTGHVDHAAVCRWATAAVERWGPARTRLYYAAQTAEWVERLSAEFDIRQVMMDEGIELPATDPADLAIDIRLDDELVDLKLAALDAQASQIAGLSAVIAPETWRWVQSLETYRLP